jgi:hypothetical protein
MFDRDALEERLSEIDEVKDRNSELIYWLDKLSYFVDCASFATVQQHQAAQEMLDQIDKAALY